jgi:hypothetical protein
MRIPRWMLYMWMFFRLVLLALFVIAVVWVMTRMVISRG